jgi:hypothetical protein
MLILVLYSPFSVSVVGEVQGVLEQIATLAVIGGYPGSLLFGFFISENAPFHWPGAAYALATLYSLSAALLFYYHVYRNSDGVSAYPRQEGGGERGGGRGAGVESDNSVDGLLEEREERQLKSK